MQTLPALLLAAAGVGFGHAVMPDHWMPLAVVARARRYSAQRVLRLSLAAGVAHVVVSVLLGGVLVLVGLRFRATFASHIDLVVGGILVATGVVFLVLELLGRGHSHDHDHSHDHGHDGHDHHGHDGHDHHGHDGHDHHGHDRHDHAPDVHGHAPDAFGEHQPHRTSRLTSLLVPFGAAASPDLTILPVFLAAGALGGGAAVGSLAVFAIVTVTTIVVLTVATAAGARLLTAPWIDRSANLLTAGTLLLVGGLVAFGLI